MNARAGSVFEHEAFEDVRVGSANWLAVLIALSCLLLIALAITGLASPGFRAWLPSVLVTLTLCVAFAEVLLSRFCVRRCASCGSTMPEVIQNLSECPNCRGLFRNVRAALPKDGVLCLNNILTSSDPIANALGMTIALGVRDGARELRIAGRKFADDKTQPWDCICADWRMWLTLEETSHQLVPPTEELGKGMFLILRRIHQKASEDSADGRARFRIEVDDCAVDAELVVQECEKEMLARIIYDSETPRQEWKTPQTYFKNALVRVAGPDMIDATPQETTWKRFPRFIPRWALFGISALMLAASAVSLSVWQLTGIDTRVLSAASLLLLVATVYLLYARKKCRHCGALLRQWSEDALPIWCPDCHSVFDPSGQSLPMDGSTLRLEELAKSGDEYAGKLDALLDYALNCRREKVEFSIAEQSAEMHISKGDVRRRFRHGMSYDCRMFYELLAEIDRRVKEKSGEGVAEFKIIGRLYEASATLSLEESNGERRASVCLDYPDVSAD
jgi:hypothetical protein